MIFRRSLYVAEDLAAGDVLTGKNLRIIRPGLGLPPKYFETLIGKRVGRAVRRGTPMSWDLLTSADDAAASPQPATRRGALVPDKPHVCLIVDNPLRDLEGLVLLGGNSRPRGARSRWCRCTSRDSTCRRCGRIWCW